MPRSFITNGDAERDVTLSEALFGPPFPRLIAARERALSRNPRLTPPAINNAGVYTLLDGSTVSVVCSLAAPANATNFPTDAARNLAGYDAVALTEGGYRAIAYGGNVFAAGAKTSASVWDSPGGKSEAVGRHTTETNAPAITMVVNSGGTGGAKRMRFLINGQYIDLAGHALANTAAVAQYFTLTFSSGKTRAITLEAQWRFMLQRIMLVQGTNYYALNRPADRRPRLLVVADSYGVGPAIGTGIVSDETLTMQGDGMYQQAADWLGVEGIVNAIGGTGIIAGAAGLRYSDRWQDVLDVHAQDPLNAIHIHGSVNDAYSAATIADIQAATVAYLLKAVKAFPTLPITMSGCFQLTGTVGDKAVLVEAAYAAALATVVAQTGSARLKYIPVQAPFYVPNWPAPGASSSLVSVDGTHLQPGTGGGHEACGQRMGNDLYRAWIDMR